LYENIQHVAVLIDGTPQVMPVAIDGENHLIQVPLITRTGTATPERIGILLAERAAPFADGFVGHDDPMDPEQLFDIAIAEAEAVIQLDTVANNLGGKTMVFVAFRGGWRGHAWLALHLPIWLIASLSAQG
jgi:hypothetical protein